MQLIGLDLEFSNLRGSPTRSVPQGASKGQFHVPRVLTYHVKYIRNILNMKLQ